MSHMETFLDIGKEQTHTNMVSKTRKTLPSQASDWDSESSVRNSKVNNNFGGDCRGTTRKRKASSLLESPVKREKGDDDPSRMEAAQVLPKGVKRKANPERGPSCKKKRGGNDATNIKAGDRSEELRTTESPGSSSTHPSTPQCHPPPQSLEARRADFEAKYLQLDKLGEGGFGSVFAGIRKTDSFPVAIKHIPLSDVDFIPYFAHGRWSRTPIEVVLMEKVAGHHTEGQSAAISLLDWYRLEKELLLVMERPVPSVDLMNYINDKGHLGEDTAKDIMKQLVEAAMEMHAARVFHRDLKPQNVLIQTTADVLRVRIIDFGCSRVVKETPYLSLNGTSAYAPPEFLMKGRYEAGPTTVWQLGGILYEMLDETNQFDTLGFLRNEIRISDKLSPDCQHFLQLCLASNPKERLTLQQMKLHPWLKPAQETARTSGCIVT